MEVRDDDASDDTACGAGNTATTDVRRRCPPRARRRFHAVDLFFAPLLLAAAGFVVGFPVWGAVVWADSRAFAAHAVAVDAQVLDTKTGRECSSAGPAFVCSDTYSLKVRYLTPSNGQVTTKIETGLERASGVNKGAVIRVYYDSRHPHQSKITNGLDTDDRKLVGSATLTVATLVAAAVVGIWRLVQSRLIKPGKHRRSQTRDRQR